MQFHFETLHSEWEAKIHFAYSSFARTRLAHRPSEHFQSQNALMQFHFETLPRNGHFSNGRLKDTFTSKNEVTYV